MKQFENVSIKIYEVMKDNLLYFVEVHIYSFLKVQHAAVF